MRKFLFYLVFCVTLSCFALMFSATTEFTKRYAHTLSFDTTAAVAVDTSDYIYVPFDFTGFNDIYFARSYSIVLGGMVSGSLFTDIELGLNWGAGVWKTLAIDTITTDSGFIEKWLSEDVAADSFPKYSDLRFRFRWQTDLADSGGTIAEKADSTWPAAIHILAKGI